LQETTITIACVMTYWGYENDDTIFWKSMLDKPKFLNIRYGLPVKLREVIDNKTDKTTNQSSEYAG